MRLKNIKIGNVKFKNPVLTASGTFGFGYEFKKFFDINILGGIVLKGLSYLPKLGNPQPRIAEAYCGMINSIGLENPGVKYFISEIYPKLRGIKTNIFANILGEDIDEYLKIITKLENPQSAISNKQSAKFPHLSGYEINISCPNVKKGGLAIGYNLNQVETLIKKVRKITDKMVMVKLGPDMDIINITRFCIKNNIDAVSLINTVPVIKIDLKKGGQFYFKNKVAGLSGPCIKPIALKKVWEVAKLGIPVIGIGGIMNAQDVHEFLAAGATIVQVGSANLIDPCITKKIIHNLKKMVLNYRYQTV
jgi:dihydroorotate dehydrogenase (NAD+) catalytic subunit